MTEKTDSNGFTAWQKTQLIEQLTRIRKEILFREGFPDTLPLLNKSEWAALRRIDARSVTVAQAVRIRKMMPDLAAYGLITLTGDGGKIKETTERGIKAIEAYNNWSLDESQRLPWKGTAELAHTCQVPLGAGKILKYAVADNLGAVQELLRRIGA